MFIKSFIFCIPFVCTSRDEYRSMKWQWQSMTKTQEKNFSEFRERKHLIGKDKILYIGKIL